MIYIHVPFCRSFCTYCDFYSEIAGKGCDGEFRSWLDSLKEEIRGRKEEIDQTYTVDTLYIGGGTPSVLPLSVLSSLMEAVDEVHPGPFSEFTFELNPEDLVEKGPGYARGLKNLGVDRVSMGVQSFDDGILRWMNRRHNRQGALEAFRILREAGFDNISIDLIFGLPQLSEKLWEETLDRVTELRPEHISSYMLSLEEDSVLGRMASEGRWKEAPEEQCSRQYDILCRRLAFAGYRHYEISNFALPGREAVHNSAYWRRLPYVGLGPGAHSLLGNNVRCWNSKTLPSWHQDGEVLSEKDIVTEEIMLGLRTDAGLPAARVVDLCGEDAVARLLKSGCLEEAYGPQIVGKRIRISERKFFVSDEIIRELL